MHTILLADDEVIERTFLKKMFQKYSSTFKVVGEVNNGLAAIDFVAQHSPNIVIIDVRMPECNGLEATMSIKQTAPSTIIIINSAYAEFDFARQAIVYGANDYLLKPAQEDVIIPALQKAIAQQQSQQNPFQQFYSRHAAEIDYPYHLESEILNALSIHEAHLLQNKFEELLQFFRNKSYSLDSCRIYLLNLLLNIQNSLKSSNIPVSLLGLLNTNRYLKELSAAPTWLAAFTILENYLQQLLNLLDSSNLFTQKCSATIMNYIKQNYTHKITLEDLAEHMHFSPAYISRIFHKETGTTLNSYINRYRIDKAKDLLENSHLPIKQIAVMVGFGNISHFNRVFKEITGKVPAEARKVREGKHFETEN